MGLQEVVRVRWRHKGGPLIMGLMSLEATPENVFLCLLCEDTERWQPPAGQEECSHQELTLPAL